LLVFYKMAEAFLENEDITALSPLVSVIVVTFNSSKYVLETLESIKLQSYKNIELIITDDCSRDNTVEICKIWIETNRNRFLNTKLVTSIKNTGIAVNCNRGLYAAEGLWIKLIAGDDLLEKECIRTNVSALCKTGRFFSFSKFTVLTDDKSVKEKIEREYENGYYNFQGNQLDNLMNNGYYFPSVTFFAKACILKQIGGFNENYPFQEDYPMWFKILKSGYEFCFIDSVTIFYRVHGNSVYRNNGIVVNKHWHQSFKKFYYMELFPERISRRLYLKAWDSMVNFLYLDLTILLGNRRGKIDHLCKLVRLLSPLYIKNILIRFYLYV